MTAYLIAASRMHAGYSAEADWGWDRIGKDTWRRRDGEKVKFAQGREWFRGMPQGTRVFFGYGAEEDPGFREVLVACDIGRLAYVPENGQ